MKNEKKAKIKVWWHDNKADVLFYGGSALALAGGAYMTYKAYKKADSISQWKYRSQAVKKNYLGEDLKNKLDAKTRFHYCGSLSAAYAKNVFDFAKTFWLPVTMVIAGETCAVLSHVELKKQAANLAVELAGVTASFMNYRNNTRFAMGSEFDTKMLTSKIVEGKLIDEEGKEVIVPELQKKSTEELKQCNMPFEFILTKDNPAFTGVRDDTYQIIARLVQHASDLNLRLRKYTKGCITVAEVREYFEDTPNESDYRFGWKSTGEDSYQGIIFTLWDGDQEAQSMFINGEIDYIKITLNPDGLVQDLMATK